MKRMKTAMYECPLSTQRMLLDHLRRIVEGVHVFDMGTSDERWWFGFGDDLLISERFEDDDPQANVRAINIARIGMFLACLNVEAQDRPRGPNSILKAAKTGHDDLITTLAKHFDDKPNLHRFFRHGLPEDLGAGLEEAYAFEMLSKLNQVVDRSKTEAVREILLLEKVPEQVDDYVVEAAVCFRYGLDKACLAVCRAALEQILKRKIERTRGKKALQKTTSGGKPVQKNLYDFIEDARGWKYLDDELAGAAHEIRKWGNGAVHNPKRGNIPIPKSTERIFMRKLAEEALLNSKRILRHLCP